MQNHQLDTTNKVGHIDYAQSASWRLLHTTWYEVLLLVGGESRNE